MKWLKYFTVLSAMLVSIACISLSAPANAQEIEGDRPGYTDSALTVPASNIQVEGGYSFTWEPDSMEHSLGELLVRWGLLDWMELRFGINSFLWTIENDRTDQGKDDMSLGIKFQIFRSPGTGSPAPDIAVIVWGMFPTGSGRYREPQTRWGGELNAEWHWGGAFNLGMSAAYAYQSENRNRYHQGSIGVNLGWEASDIIAFFCEYYVIFPDSPGGGNGHFMDMGITAKILENLMLDISAGTRLDRREYFAGTGAIARFTY